MPAQLLLTVVGLDLVTLPKHGFQWVCLPVCGVNTAHRLLCASHLCYTCTNSTSLMSRGIFAWLRPAVIVRFTCVDVNLHANRNKSSPLGSHESISTVEHQSSDSVTEFLSHLKVNTFMQEEAKGQTRTCSFGFHLRGCFRQQFQFQEVDIGLLAASGFTSQYLPIVKNG